MSETIRETIRSYEATVDPLQKEILAEKIRCMGRDSAADQPWAEAFEICVAYNAEQERACAAWKVEREIELAANMTSYQTPALEKRLSMRYALLAGRTAAEIAAMTSAQRFAHGFVPRWLRSSWNYKGVAGDAVTRIDGEVA